MKIFFKLLFLLLGVMANAKVELPLMFSDGMVLQRNKPINIWGWAKAYEKVTVTFKNQTLKTKTNIDGKWEVKLQPEPSGGPFSLIIKGENIITLNNVLIGEVWVCSGQSNMEWTVSNSNNFEEEIKDCNYPLIRHFNVEKDMSSVPRSKLKSGQWDVCSRKTVGNFTAVGYFFAKNLYKKLKIPIGIINTTWGGTCVETWISTSAFKNNDTFKDRMVNFTQIDIEALELQQRTLVQDRINKLQGTKLDLIDETKFKNKDFNDSRWPEMHTPKLWEDQELGELDGTVWLRKTIVVSKNDANKKALLKLAKIDDQDVTYINGIEVGTTTGYKKSRTYKIKEGVLKPGNNVIAIKIFDYAGGGGIWGDAKDLQLITNDNTITLEGDWKYQVVNFNTSVSPNRYPSLLFNAMINPLIPYTIQGAVWYQGEANVSRSQEYKRAFPLLIHDWRNQWLQGEFPFYFVQLSSFDEFGGNSNNGSKWAELREAQSFTVETVSNTGLAVTIDIGNPKDIHPRNKQDVGKRLSAIALSETYNSEDAYVGPQFESMEIKRSKIILNFNNIGSGLKAKNKYGYLKGFEVAGASKVFYYAKAYIDNNQIIVSCSDVTEPKAVRYGWADDAGDCNLYNNEGFPAAPFRTDNWEMITSSEAYKF